MSLRVSKFIQLGIVGIWLCLIIALVYRYYIAGVEPTPLQALSKEQFRTGDEWFGMYMKQRKIGHMHATAERIGNEYRFTQFSETALAGGDGPVRNRTTFKCLTDLSYRIKSFEFESRTGDSVMKYSGDIDDDNVLLAYLESDSQKKTWADPLDTQPYHPLTIKHMLYARGFEKGRRYTIPVLNVLTFKVDDIVVAVDDLVPVKSGINVNTAYKLNIGDARSWVTDGGATLKESNPSGVLYLAEPEDIAVTQQERPFFDFLSMPLVKADRVLSAPEDLSLLRVRLSGPDISAYPLLDEGRQSLKGKYLEIRKEETETVKEQTYDLPYAGNDQGLPRYLQATPFVQSDHHTVIYNAEKFAAIEKNAFRLARYLVSNLYLTITKAPSFLILDAMDIFKTRAGGSNEHAVMLASFARAAGMPARIVSGFVYSKGYFYFHTWNEVWIGRWVAVDAAMGQFPADVTHIRMAEGDIDDVASLGSKLQNVTIHVLEAL